MSAVSPSRGHSAVSVRESGVRGDRARPNVSLKSLNSHFTRFRFSCVQTERADSTQQRDASREMERAPPTAPLSAARSAPCSAHSALTLTSHAVSHETRKTK